jgi:hypothetical protein
MQSMKGHDPDVAKWLYRMMNDPDFYEQWRFLDTIDEYNNLIAESQKHYEQTPLADLFMRAKFQSVIRECKKDLAKTMAQYDRFKRFKARTTIAK